MSQPPDGRAAGAVFRKVQGCAEARWGFIVVEENVNSSGIDLFDDQGNSVFNFPRL